jgi:hypothetical protein
VPGNSGFGYWITHTNNPLVSWLQDDQLLQNMQYGCLGVAAAALTVAGGAVILEAVGYGATLSGTSASAGLGAVEGPAATLQAAEAILGTVPKSAQAIAILETQEGITLVGGGVADLSAAQIAVAEQAGLRVVAMAGEHAEVTVIQAAAELGLKPTFGVVTNNVCAGICTPVIRQIGGWVAGKFFGF